MPNQNDEWRHCSTCKKPIEFEQSYYECSVSTCTRKRTGLFFCSLGCWEAHLPMMRHRDAWAVEARAPSRAEWEAEQAAEAASEGESKSAAVEAPRRRVVASGGDDLPRDVLVVISKLKAYVRARSGMNTSDGVARVLSDALRRWCDRAIDNAARDGRKTVLDRDFSSRDG
jgi:hypothetical protein